MNALVSNYWGGCRHVVREVSKFPCKYWKSKKRADYFGDPRFRPDDFLAQFMIHFAPAVYNAACLGVQDRKIFA